jgi:hypothetical protein
VGYKWKKILLASLAIIHMYPTPQKPWRRPCIQAPYILGYPLSIAYRPYAYRWSDAHACRLLPSRLWHCGLFMIKMSIVYRQSFSKIKYKKSFWNNVFETYFRSVSPTDWNWSFWNTSFGNFSLRNLFSETCSVSAPVSKTLFRNTLLRWCSVSAPVSKIMFQKLVFSKLKCP